ncbi:MAG: c-type cytochrome [Thermoleophilia bacterium]
MSTAGRPSWPLLLGMLAVVTLAVYGLSRLHPFQPSAPAAADVPPGDAARGADLFARTCAGCHGPGGAGGGIGPKLVDAGLDAPTVAGIVAAGRGAMPAGLLKDQDAADVSAYVAGISGGAAPTTGTTGTAIATVGPPVAAGGTFRFTGPGLRGFRVDLAEAPGVTWNVIATGTAGDRPLVSIPPESTLAVVPDSGVGPLIDGVDRFLVGPSADAPALVATLTPVRAEQLRRLLVGDPDLPGGASTLDAASGQVKVMRDHIRFLRLALREGNLANIRFHGEHMVNLAYGNPPEDVDGNGDPSNPGDGVGLLGPEGGRPGYLPRILSLSGGSADVPAADLTLTIAEIATQGRVCGRAGSLNGARRCVATIAASDRRLAGLWREVRARALASATIPLEAP